MLQYRSQKKPLQFTFDDGTGTDRTILSGIVFITSRKNWLERLYRDRKSSTEKAMMGIDFAVCLSVIHEEEGEEKLLLMVDDHIPAGAKALLR